MAKSMDIEQLDDNTLTTKSHNHSDKEPYGGCTGKCTKESHANVDDLVTHVKSHFGGSATVPKGSGKKEGSNSSLNRKFDSLVRTKSKEKV